MPVFTQCDKHSPPIYFDTEETGGYCPRCGALSSADSHYDVQEYDNVNRPMHYNQGNIECIDAMIAAYGIEAVKTYCKLASFKYLWRHSHKGSPEQDIDKALWYLRFSQGDDPRGYKK